MSDQIENLLARLRKRLSEEGGQELLQALERLLTEKNLRRDFLSIVLGNIWNVEDFLHTLSQRKMEIDNDALTLLHSVGFQQDTRVVNLTLVSVADLGFTLTPNYDEVCAAGKRQGYCLCTPDIVAHLRLNYRDQPRGETLVAAMDPLGHPGHRQVFEIVNYRGRKSIGIRYVDSIFRMDTDQELVFVQKS